MTAPQGPKGLFEGLKPETKGKLVMECLSYDHPVTLAEIMAKTGLSSGQVHNGINYLRKQKDSKHCIITETKGKRTPTYHLATEAGHVNDYAQERLRGWQSQIKVMVKEMEDAKGLFPNGWDTFISTSAKTLSTLLGTIETYETGKAALDAAQKKLDAERAKFEKEKEAARTSRRKRTVAA